MVLCFTGKFYFSELESFPMKPQTIYKNESLLVNDNDKETMTVTKE